MSLRVWLSDSGTILGLCGHFWGWGLAGESTSLGSWGYPEQLGFLSAVGWRTPSAVLSRCHDGPQTQKREATTNQRLRKQVRQTPSCELVPWVLWSQRWKVTKTGYVKGYDPLKEVTTEQKQGLCEGSSSVTIWEATPETVGNAGLKCKFSTRKCPITDASLWGFVSLF